VFGVLLFTIGFINMGRNSTYSRYLRQCRRCYAMFWTPSREGRVCSNCCKSRSGRTAKMWNWVENGGK